MAQFGEKEQGDIQIARKLIGIRKKGKGVMDAKMLIA